MLVLNRDHVRAHLDYPRCIAIVRQAMQALSAGRTQQLLRSIIPLGERRMFGIMPGDLGEDGGFGAKLVSVFPGNFEKDLSSHQGLIILFDPESGAPAAVLDAAEITARRTAAASAAATDALARPAASRLALLGYGEQAAAHAHAVSHIRDLDTITVWGRSRERAAAFAERTSRELNLPVVACASAAEAVAKADIICTVTAASEPILTSSETPDGAHLNVVGSSYAGPVEIDDALVARARFVADSGESVLTQGAEFLSAKEAGLVDDSHVVAEIGEVFLGEAEGRQFTDQVTIYKSLGHVVQDLATAWDLFARAREAGKPAPLGF